MILYRRTIASVAVSLLIPAATALATLYNCYVLITWPCCTGWISECPYSFGGFDFKYTCQSTSTGSCDIQAAVNVHTGRHFDTSQSGPEQCRCTITIKLCNPNGLECLPGGTTEAYCHDAILYGYCVTP